MSRVIDESWERDDFTPRVPDSDEVRKMRDVLDPVTDDAKAWVNTRFARALLEASGDERQAS